MSTSTSYVAEKRRPNRSQQSQEDFLEEGQHRRVYRRLDEFDRSQVVLYESQDYLLLNKPADVRMDGAFDVTIQKLLVHWYPGSTSASFKWVHQLDFATSGILCVALNRKAAAAASMAFAERRVKKQYLALIEGHLDISRWPEMSEQEAAAAAAASTTTATTTVPSDFPVLVFGAKKAREEDEQDEEKEEKKTHTVAAEDSWQVKVRNANLATFLGVLAVELEKAKESPVSATATATATARGPDNLQELRELGVISKDSFLHDAKLRKRLRKALKARGIHVDVLASQGGAKEESVADEEEASGKETSSTRILCSAPPPFSIFRLRSAVEGSGVGSDVLRINAPVAEISGDFRCEVGHSLNVGKECQTDLQVLQYSTYQGSNVTKVLLSPRTGRRHQLRIHCLALGHAIVGDGTYAQSSLVHSSERMMLHAYKLSIPEIAQGEAPDPYVAL